VSERIDCGGGFVASWSRRFTEQRIAGLYSRHLGQVATVLTRNWKHGVWRRPEPTDYRQLFMRIGAVAG
jgi:hypothetical protein